MRCVKQVAKLLGLKPYEVFKLKGTGRMYRFVELQNTCLEVFNLKEHEWERSEDLQLILTGFFDIEKMTFKPLLGQRYYYYEDEEAISVEWLDDATDLALWKVGNCFETKEEALEKGKEKVDKIWEEYNI